VEEIQNHASNAGYIGAAVAAIVGIAYGLRQVLVRWRQDGTNIAAADATTAEYRARQDIVEQLHAELERLHQQRMTLTEELHKLQLHIVELTRQVALLTTENGELRAEIIDLRGEISRLKQME
jgi:cell division protein FtsB